MARPPMTGSFSEELYDQLAPLARHDEANGWHLLHLCSALGLSHQVVEDLARDTDEGPGWSILLDVDRCPVWALGWLGQFVGASLLPKSPDESDEQWDADMRARIRLPIGIARGSVAALRLAAERYLTGSRSVIFEERQAGHAYRLGIYTLASETPDSATVLRAILEQKPGGIVLTYATYSGRLYSAVEPSYATYAAAEAGYSSYDAAEAGP